MSTHYSAERINDAIDGLLDASEMADLESHVRECGACREAYATLSETVAELRALPTSARAPESLWRDIDARIAGTVPHARVGGASVISFPGAATVRRWSFGVPQLAGAAVVASVLSAGVTWSLVSRSPGSLGSAGSEVGADLGPAARAVSFGSVGYDEAVTQLESIVREGRGLLAPETVASMEGSLRMIDAALADVRAALDEDPASPLLARMLIQQQESRLRVLRQAASAVRARS